MFTRPLENVLNELNELTKILGLNITGSKTIAVYGDINGQIYERMQMATPAEAPFLEGFDAVCGLADKLLKVTRAQGLKSPEVISLAISGPLDIQKGMILAPPDLPEWIDAQLRGRLGVRYNLPTFIEHHSNAAALAEYYFGAGIGVQNMILLDMEPVISAGIIAQGLIYHGENDAAGDIGRMRMTKDGPAGLGEPGSLTGYASGPGMAELARLRYPGLWSEPLGTYEFVKAILDGQPEAIAVLEEAADHLGNALLWLIFTLDPELVVFGHPGDVLNESLLSPLRDAVLRYGGGQAQQLPRLAVSKLGAKLDDTAALMAVIDLFKRRKLS